MFQPEYTMNGIELHRLRMQHRILRIFTSTLPSLQISYQNFVEGAVVAELTKASVQNTLDGMYFSWLIIHTDWILIMLSNIIGWTSLLAFPVIKNIVGKANFHTFYGGNYGKTSHP